MKSWRSQANAWLTDVLNRFRGRAAPEQRDLAPKNEEISRWVDEGGSGSDPRRPTPTQPGGDAR